MNRANSLRQIPSVNPEDKPEGIPHSKSLPNIDINNPTGKPLHFVKRQNSKRGKIFQKTWDKVKTIIQPSSSARRDSKIKPTLLEQTNSSSRTQSPIRKSAKCERDQSYNLLSTSSAPSTPIKKLVFDFERISIAATTASKQADEEEDQVLKQNYEKLQKRLSEELHQAVRGDSERKKEETLSEDFKKRLQQWDMWKASTGKYHYTPDELQKLIPSDFSKKLQEWEDLKTRPKQGPLAETQQHPHSPTATASISSSSKRPQRKKKNSDEASRQKQLVWLENQLEKIEVEKKRLEREMKKYCEREARLQKLKEALKNTPGPKEEVWIKTPTAECKVEGINEKFAKKLFKWEERQGIEPESSTMALLNPKYYTPNPESQSVDLEINDASPPAAENDEMAKQYTSSDESEADVDAADADYEEATDSFATKDEGASGASNTDSECFNLKPSSYRRRSSDALSTPLSARSPSLSGCTSEDELDNPNPILFRVVSNSGISERSEQERESIRKAKPILVGGDEKEDQGPNSIIVQTKRTIFAPVLEEVSECSGADRMIPENVKPPGLLKSLISQSAQYSLSGGGEPIWKRMDPPRVVGVVRKGTSYDLPSPIPNFSPGKTTSALPPQPEPIRPNFPRMGGKIPVWCSPLMARRRYQEDLSESSKFKPSHEYTIDNFLQQTNLIPSASSPITCPQPTNTPPSRIAVLSPPGLRRKYTIGGGFPPRLNMDNEPVRLLSLTRSSSFQGHHRPTPPIPIPVESRPPLPTVLPPIAPIVAKSKSTGSMFGSCSGVTKGLFGFASKFGIRTEQKGGSSKSGHGHGWLKLGSASQQYGKK